MLTRNSNSPSRPGTMLQYGRMSMKLKKKLNVKFEYKPIAILGSGAFGVVFASKNAEGNFVAIKKVKEDPKYKNRELEIMQRLQHRNCIKILSYFKSSGKNNGDIFMNIVMEYVPMSLEQFIAHYRKQNLYTPLLFIKLYAFQLLAGLNYLHNQNIVHRDIKPQNLLVNPDTGELKICDFGSAKRIINGEISISYIASRYYRAPELTMGDQFYSSPIDVWSAGCCIVEMLNGGYPLFPGKSADDQILAIAKVIGKPTSDDMRSFYHEDKDFFKGFDSFGTTPLYSKLPKHTPADLYDLLKSIFVYNPRKRPSAYTLMQHPYFDELFKLQIKMPSNRPLPILERGSQKRIANSSDGLRFI